MQARGITLADAGILSAAVVYIGIQLIAVSRRVPLGHDEAAYMLRARYYAGNAATGADIGFWAPYRAPGLSAVISVPMRILGESITMSRLIVVLFGAAGIILLGILARSFSNARVGSVAAWLVVLSPAYTSYGGLLLLDVPGVALSLAAAVALERATRTGVVKWWPGLMVPVWCMAAVYVRFGTTTTLAAALLGVVAARADLLWEQAVRVQNAIRLGVLALLSAAAAGSILLIPFMTGSLVSPFRAQRDRQVAKGISPWASYGDMIDLMWPDGSRAGETFSAVVLVALIIGWILTAIAVLHGRYRRLALAASVSVVVWIIGLNYALAELFGNYIGLGVPFLAMLAAPGWVYIYDIATTTSPRRSVSAVLVGAFVAISMVFSVNSSLDQTNALKRNQWLRDTGNALNAQSPDQECAVITSYIQIAWYADCLHRAWGHVANGKSYRERPFTAEDPLLRSVSDKGLPLDDIQQDQVYFVIIERGKRQPTGDTLDIVLDDAELVFDVTNGRRPINVYRLVEF
jgi:hypothetical protein